MRKSFSMDSRARDFNLDPDHAGILDAARQDTGAGMEKHRAPAPDRGPEPERALTAEAGVRLRPQAPGLEGPDGVGHRDVTIPDRD